MANAPDSLVVTGPNLQQISIGALLITPTSGTQQTLANALEDINTGTLTNVTLAGTTTNSGTLSGGIETGITLAGANTNSGTLNGGTLAGTITNAGTITGGTFIGLGSAGNALTTTGSTQAGALSLAGFEFVNLGTVAAGTGALLAPSAAGEFQIVANAGTNAAALYATGTVDTINGVAGTIGMPLGPNAMLLAQSTAAGAIEAGVLNPVQSAYIANTVSASATIAASNLWGAEAFTALDMTGSLGATGTITLPTIAALQAVIPAPTTTTSWTWRILNHSAGNFAWTLGATSGYTLNGTLSAAQSTFRDFVVKFTSNTAVTIQDVGGGTIV